VCNVSTCNRKRTGLVFCSVTCWEVHLPEANHRETWAVEKTAPREAPASPTETSPAKPPNDSGMTGRRRVVREPVARANVDAEREILIVASRLKDYIRATSGFNTSDGVLKPLSDAVRRLCDEAIASATRSERKTVLERDVPRGGR
jgi:hypothetical protein